MEMGFHPLFRYVQRVMGINDGAKAYVDSKRYEVAYNLLQLINESDILMKGYAPARRDTLDYYIKDNILIVMKPDKREVVTLFNVTLSSKIKENNAKIKKYVSTIKKNNAHIQLINGKQAKQDQITHHLIFSIERFKGKISEELISELQREKEESINICKEYAAQAKQLRLENRELMSEMFKKIDMEE